MMHILSELPNGSRNGWNAWAVKPARFTVMRTPYASILFVLLLNSAATVTHAQHSGIGIKGGPLMSTTRSGSVSARSLLGGTFGLYFPLRAGDRLEMQPELLVTALGAGYSRPDGSRMNDRTAYVQLPVAAKIYFGNVVNVQVGVQMGLLILAQRSIDTEVEDVRENYEQMDAGIILGAGADLVQGVDIGLRYYNGLKAAAMNADNQFPRNRAYMLTVGYRFARLRAPKFNRRRG
jgi:hypothetical protein